MQKIVIKLGWLLQVTVGTTAAESVSASANIFLGQVSKILFNKAVTDRYWVVDT